MATRTEELQRRLNLKTHLAQLALLTSRVITDNELLPVSAIGSIQAQSIKLIDPKTIRTWEVAFADKQTEEFERFIDTLYGLNSSRVYVWTKLSNVCGLLEVGSIQEINFNFPFSALPEGIVSFLTCDLRDNMLLDWEQSETDRRLKIELTGANWPSAKGLGMGSCLNI